MKRVAVLLVGMSLISIGLFAEEENVAEEEMLVIEKKPNISVSKTYGSSRLTNWYVLDNRTLIVEVNNREKYKASLMNTCTGLRFTDSIAFSTLGPFELNKWTTIILPHGQRCYIKELSRYTKEEEKYDRAERKKAKAKDKE